MAIFDTYRVLDDSESLSAGMQIKFTLSADCPPFGAPTADDVSQAFSGTSLSVMSVSAGIVSSLVPVWDTGTIAARVNEVVTVGALRAQILAAGQVVNSQKSIPCWNWGITDNEIDLLTAAGTGVAGLPSVGTGLSVLSLAAIAVIAIVAWAFWRDLTVV